MNYTSIKNWAEEDRPREKLLEKGCSSLTETELLAILIGSGTKNTSALDIAKIIFSKANNNLNELYKCTITDLMQFKGIGEARAITLSAAFELGRRRNIAEVRQKKQISSSKEIFNLMHPKIGDLKHEEFWAIYLNQKNAIIGEKRISIGGISQTTVDTKIIARHAIECLATGIIVCHNHPSENCRPSREDKVITEQINNAMKLIDCSLLDHVIISGENYFSFCDESLL
ncbi:MAG: DNA repair protein RadC [Bacteroidales bacterium]|nr:DNA repair protein RadC [Bacteroidales bacterium]